jgi:ATP-dependent RNA helicase DDX60
MDLDTDDGPRKPLMKISNNLSAFEALDHINENWFAEVSRKSRWMDLIGDFAGNERFIVDGERNFPLHGLF